MSLCEYLTRLAHINIRPLDREFAGFLQDLAPSQPHTDWLGFVVSAQLGHGHVCLDFTQPHDFLTQDDLTFLHSLAQSSDVVLNLNKMDQGITRANLPLVLDGQRLYLQRYWQYEKQLQLCIEQGMTPKTWDLTAEKSFIQNLFQLGDESNEINWQAIAACIAAKNAFTVVTGGPGTGKTTTVIRLLALLVKLYQSQAHHQPIIKLVAPTGKAAMRLTESISGAKQALDVDEGIKSAITEQASTIHRLLKSNGRGFRYHAQNPLHLDVLVVDEASMVDLPLMTKLMQALPPNAQVILLGDKDQLASVEAGSVLADMCDGDVQHGYSLETCEELNSLLKMDLSSHVEQTGARLREHICHLRKSFRFDEQSGIGLLASAANAGDVSQWQALVNQDFADLNMLTLSDSNFDLFIQQAVNNYGQYIQAIEGPYEQGSADQQALHIHQLFTQFQVLCALREGTLGVSGLNDAIEQGLAKKGLIDPSTAWYLGRPLMIMQNDYGLNLYNGDIGLILPQKNEQGEVTLKAVFVGSDQQVRWLQPSRLPLHETVFAMTVHKSQGSEFDHCAFVLPDYDTQVLSKELIYTGITRAKTQLTCLSQPSVLQAALSRQVQRASGLRDRLWMEPSDAQGDPKTHVNGEACDGKPQANDSSQYSLF